MERVRFQHFLALYQTRRHRDLLFPREVLQLYKLIHDGISQYQRNTFLDLDFTPTHQMCQYCEDLFATEMETLLVKLKIPYLPAFHALYPLLLKNYFFEQLTSPFNSTTALDFVELVQNHLAIPNQNVLIRIPEIICKQNSPTRVGGFPNTSVRKNWFQSISTLPQAFILLSLIMIVQGYRCLPPSDKEMWSSYIRGWEIVPGYDARQAVWEIPDNESYEKPQAPKEQIVVLSRITCFAKEEIP